MENSKIGVILLKVAGIYVYWYLIYDLWLLPDGSIDQWITTNLVSVSAGIVDALGYDFYATGRMLGIDESVGIYLADGTSGISTIGLFIGFVVAYPGAWIPRLAFIFIGIGVIYIVNIIRVIVITLTQVQAPDMFPAIPGDSITAIFYLVIFALWIVWANYGDNTHAINSSSHII